MASHFYGLNSQNQTIDMGYSNGSSTGVSPSRHSKKVSNMNIDDTQPILVLSPHSINFASKI